MFPVMYFVAEKQYSQISYVAHLIHHILIPDVADMLQFIFSEKRVKNVKQTLICIRHIPNTYFYSMT